MIPTEVYTILNQIWPIIFIFVTVIGIIRFFHLQSTGKSFILYKEFMSLVFIIYLLLLFELVTNTDMASIGNNFTPFKEIFRYKLGSNLFFRNVIGNIAVFIPFGYFVYYYIKNCEFWKMFMIGAVTSFTIESVQYKIGRSFDIDDIILNIIGVIIGWYLYKVIKKIQGILPKFTKSGWFLNLLSFVFLVLIILVFVSYVGIWKIW